MWILQLLVFTACKYSFFKTFLIDFGSSASPLLDYSYISPLLQSRVRQVISLAPVWFPVTHVREITTSLNTAAPTASPVPSMGPPPLPGQPPYSTAPVSYQNSRFLSHTQALLFFVFD